MTGFKVLYDRWHGLLCFGWSHWAWAGDARGNGNELALRLLIEWNTTELALT